MKIAQVQVQISNVLHFKKKILNEQKSISELLQNVSLELNYLSRRTEPYLNLFDRLLIECANLHQLYPLSFISEVEEKINTLSFLKMELVKEDGSEQLVRSMFNDLEAFLLSSFHIEITDLSKNYSKLVKYKITKDMIKNNTSNLYHGLKLNYSVEALQRGSLLGRTTHRFWEDGKRYKDNHEQYNNNYWMKGVSLSRDLEYSLNWSDVLFVFDKNTMKSSTIEPYSWHSHFSDTIKTHKEEREEFLVLAKSKKRYKNKDNPSWAEEYSEAVSYDTSKMSEEERSDYQNYLNQLIKDGDKNDLRALKSPEGEFSFIENDSLIGFVIKDTTLDVFGVNNEEVQFLINHPKFIGILGAK